MPEERRKRRGDVHHETASHGVGGALPSSRLSFEFFFCLFVFQIAFFSDKPAMTVFSSPSGAVLATGAGAKWKMSLKPIG